MPIVCYSYDLTHQNWGRPRWCQGGVSMAGGVRSRRRVNGRGKRSDRVCHEPYRWLGARALALGVGAVLVGGSGVPQPMARLAVVPQRCRATARETRRPVPRVQQVRRGLLRCQIIGCTPHFRPAVRCRQGALGQDEDIADGPRGGASCPVAATVDSTGRCSTAAFSVPVASAQRGRSK